MAMIPTLEREAAGAPPRAARRWEILNQGSRGRLGSRRTPEVEVGTITRSSRLGQQVGGGSVRPSVSGELTSPSGGLNPPPRQTNPATQRGLSSTFCPPASCLAKL